ncbi:MAG TPA: hypothetical protein VKU37_03365 [Verrucomicrobiae bacterium]|nr:hypothetical protein [Verrucomicrobiae bacterium]
MVVLLGVSTTQSQAQQYASLFRFTADPKIPVRPNLELYYHTNSLFVVISLRWDEVTLEPKPDFEEKDEKSLSFILEKVGTQKAESALMSARVLIEDSLLYMNRDASFLRSPNDLATSRGASVFRRTAVQSLGDYLDANYHPGGIIRIVRETFLNDGYDKRIISPLSPADAGYPGMANARKDDIHVGLRDLLSTNPRGFVTFSDKVEIDVAINGPSLILRNPISIDGKVLTTALAVEYPDWKVNGWSPPKVGATLAYVHGKHGVYLTASAGRDNFQPSQSGITSRYEEQIMLYTQYKF